MHISNNKDETIKCILEEIKGIDIASPSNKIKHIREELEGLADDDIITAIGMADMPLLVFLMRIKYNAEPQLIPIENDIMIRVGQCNLANMSYLALYLHFLKFNSGILEIEGNVSYPTVLGDCVLIVKENGNTLPVEFTDTGFDLKIGDNTYETRTAFKTQFKLSTDTEISFYNSLNNLEAEYGRINSLRFSPIADCIPNQYYEKDGWIFTINKNKILCKKADEDEIKKQEELYRISLKDAYPQKYEWVEQLRDYYFEKNNNKKTIWMFMDRPDRADDNGLVLFEYVQNNKKIESYFVISDKSDDYEKVKKIGNVVPLYSQKHYELAITADYVISSQCNGVVENPFWENAEFFRDLYHRPKMIFLQHGVIKDDMSPTLNRFNTNFTGFVTSTENEYKSILNCQYFYSSKEVWLTGLPRYDKLYDNKQKIILVMPSWRKELMEQTWDKKNNIYVWTVSETFLNSEYYNRYKRILTNKKLLKLCKKNGYKICFMPHPLVNRFFVDIKECVGDLVEFWDEKKSYGEAFAEGAILITDYSSVAFDFTYLRKPVIYYQYDSEKFFENHTYKKGYFDYEKDGFGEVCYNEKKVIKVLSEYLSKDCVLKGKYRNRIENSWLFKDDYCKRVVAKVFEN